MARFQPKNDIANLKKYSIKGGWIGTGEHPGYPPNKKPSGATIAQVARYNVRRNGEELRDFVTPFIAALESGKLSAALRKDVINALETKSFSGDETRTLLIEELINIIKNTAWTPNTPAWSAFKEKYNLSPHPLIASQTMLDAIRSEVSES